MQHGRQPRSDSDSDSDDASGFDRNWRDYDIVTQAVLLFPDLVAAASDANASLTVLAPSDQAFLLLVRDLTDRAARTEAETFAAVQVWGLRRSRALRSCSSPNLVSGPGPRNGRPVTWRPS